MNAFKKLGFGLLFLTAFLACKKETAEPSDPDPTATEVGLGWLGSENNAAIPNDLPFYSGTLPSKVDLTPYLPPMASQGNYGTCVAWSVGYYSRTAMYGIQKQLKTSQLNPSLQASPKDLFWAIPNAQKGQNCNGTHFQYALDVLQQRGVATMATVPYQGLGNCSNQPAAAWTQEAANLRIKSYRDLPLNTEAIKQKLAEDRPIMFGAIVTDAFMRWGGGGTMTASNILDGSSRGGHAMTIVGYDDGRRAFRIANSWGSNWGDNGFAWASYDLMTDSRFTNAVFVAYPDNAVDPNPNPTPTSGAHDLALPECNDSRDPNSGDPLDRGLEFDVHNLGSSTLRSSARWSAVYLYYNAYDMDDYGVLLHQYVTDEYGPTGSQGFYNDGLGEWDSWWNNVNLGPSKTLGQAIFGNPGIWWPYTMPEVTGFYYLVVMADPFEAVDEPNEDNNLYFMTSQDGGPIFFLNGVGTGLTGTPTADDRSADATTHQSPVNSAHLNAYTPEEVKRWIHQQKKSGALARKVARFDHQRGKGIKQGN